MDSFEFTGLVPRGDKAINERYRPRTFHEVIGNEPAKKALAGWMAAGARRSGAVMLTGPSGCGKTTISRILAMGLNCEKGDTVNPCCECASCRAAMDGSAMHIVEMNMSATTGKDDAEQTVMDMYNGAFTGRNNVYILDECLHYDSTVDCFIDGRIKKIKIGHLVSNQMHVDVLSYNHSTGKIEPKPIVNWFKNPKKTVYEWKFRRVNEKNLRHSKITTLTCTDNHTVFLYDSNQEVEIGQLKQGDIIRGNANFSTPGKIHALQAAHAKYDINQCAYEFIGKYENSKKNNRGHVYDIEVADNHNYFSNCINVHNCHGMSKSAQNLILKTLEDPPENTYIFMMTTEPDKILKTIKTRCEQYLLQLPSENDIKQMLGSVVKQEMPSMALEDRKAILEACKGLGYREILMKLEKFMKGGGTDSIGEAFQADMANFAKAVMRGDFRAAKAEIDAQENFDCEGGRRIVRSFLANQISSSFAKGDAAAVVQACNAIKYFDHGFYADPNPKPSLIADVAMACLIMGGQLDPTIVTIGNK